MEICKAGCVFTKKFIYYISFHDIFLENWDSQNQLKKNHPLEYLSENLRKKCILLLF
jgi:hypothetical protein